MRLLVLTKIESLTDNARLYVIKGFTTLFSKHFSDSESFKGEPDDWNLFEKQLLELFHLHTSWDEIGFSLHQEKSIFSYCKTEALSACPSTGAEVRPRLKLKQMHLHVPDIADVSNSIKYVRQFVYYTDGDRLPFTPAQQKEVAEIRDARPSEEDVRFYKSLGPTMSFGSYMFVERKVNLYNRLFELSVSEMSEVETRQRRYLQVKETFKRFILVFFWASVDLRKIVDDDEADLLRTIDSFNEQLRVAGDVDDVGLERPDLPKSNFNCGTAYDTRASLAWQEYYHDILKHPRQNGTEGSKGDTTISRSGQKDVKVEDCLHKSTFSLLSAMQNIFNTPRSVSDRRGLTHSY